MRTKPRRVSMEDIKSKDTKVYSNVVSKYNLISEKTTGSSCNTKSQHESHAFWAIKQMTHWKDYSSKKVHNAKKSSLVWRQTSLNFYLWLQNILKIYLMPFHCFLFSVRSVSVTAFYFAYMVLLRFTSTTVTRNCYKNVKPWRSPTFFLRSVQLHILRYLSIPIFNGSGKPVRLPLRNFKWFNSPSAKCTLRKPGPLCPTWM